MRNPQVFYQWLKLFQLGWLPIALSNKRQIFMLIDLRFKKGRYIYVMANSREEVIRWILCPENSILMGISYKSVKKLKWFNVKEIKRGKIKESFEVVRLLENELPKGTFPIFDTMDRGNLKTSTKFQMNQKKNKSNKKNNIFSFYRSNTIIPNITELSNGWYWDYNEAVFQSGVFLPEFDRMYLIRCLYRRINLAKIFLGWKVQSIREIGDSESVEHPFWDVSIKEEQNLENLLQQSGFFLENNSYKINTPKVERKRRSEFQKQL